MHLISPISINTNIIIRTHNIYIDTTNATACKTDVCQKKQQKKNNFIIFYLLIFERLHRVYLTGQNWVTSLCREVGGAGMGSGQQVSVDTAAEQVVIPANMGSGWRRTKQTFTSRRELLPSSSPVVHFPELSDSNSSWIVSLKKNVTLREVHLAGSQTLAVVFELLKKLINTQMEDSAALMTWF